MTTVSVELPGNPLSQNRCYRIVLIGKGAKRHATLALTPEGREYIARVRDLVHRSRPADWNLEAEIDVDAMYWFDSLRPDVDGPGKPTLDALQCTRLKGGGHVDDGLLLNDRQVRRFVQTRLLDRERPRLELSITVVERAGVEPRSLREPPSAQCNLFGRSR